MKGTHYRLRMRFTVSRTVGLTMLMLFLADVHRSAQTGEQNPPLGVEWNVKPFHVIGRVYSVGLSDNTSWLITTPQGHFLIDPTFEQAAPDIRRNIEQLGFQVEDIKYILLSHGHNDHASASPQFRAWSGAKVLVMAQEADALADGGASDALHLPWEETRFTPFHADQIIHDGERVQLGGVTMVAHLTAGHTKGSTTWSTVVQENDKKYDVVFLSSVRIITKNPLVGNTWYPNIATDFDKTFKTLRSLHADVWLVSHASSSNMFDKAKRMEQGKANPFIDPKGYRDFVAQREKIFRDQLQKEKAGGSPYLVGSPPLGPCPQDARSCYDSFTGRKIHR